MSLKADWVAARRRFLLALLLECGGTANESVLYKAAQRGGFARDTRDEIRADLDHLRAQGCITEEWADTVRVATLTERGEDASEGRIGVPGVEPGIGR